MIRAIIFDCFGVLVGRGFAETYRIAGGDPAQDHEFIEDTLGQANLGMIKEAEFHQRMADKLAITSDEFHQAMAKAERPNQELLDYIAELHKDYKTAILSNVNVGVLERKLSPEILRTHFDALIVSAEVGVVKPDVRIYQLAAERLGVETSECLFIDDQERYCQPAREEGMQAIKYSSVSQLKDELQAILATS